MELTLLDCRVQVSLWCRMSTAIQGRVWKSKDCFLLKTQTFSDGIWWVSFLSISQFWCNLSLQRDVWQILHLCLILCWCILYFVLLEEQKLLIHLIHHIRAYCKNPPYISWKYAGVWPLKVNAWRPQVCKCKSMNMLIICCYFQGVFQVWQRKNIYPQVQKQPKLRTKQRW